jgi:trehalose-phosphatase
VIVERKRFAVAVHFRMAAEDAMVPDIDAAIDRAVEASHPGLRRTTGKMIFELRPDLDWDKGRALQFLLGHLHLDQPDVVSHLRRRRRHRRGRTASHPS